MAVTPKISPAGSGAVLLDAARGEFETDTQTRIWAVARSIAGEPGIRNLLPGMNNLLVTFDALQVSPRNVGGMLRKLWDDIRPEKIVGAMVDVSVTYGGADLQDWAIHCGLTIEEAVRRHAAGVYLVAAVGGMPGFPYLAGLDPSLARPRRASPRASVPEGSVIIGGAQTAIMPQTAPSGWHIIGRTTVKLFDPAAEPPTLFHPGDTIRFIVDGLER